MNIAIFSDSFLPNNNGIAVSTRVLVKSLIDHGHNVLVVAPSYEDTKTPRKDSYYFIPFILNKDKDVKHVVRKYRKTILKDVINFKPEIIHNQTNGQVGQLGKYTAKLLGLPFVFTYNTHYEEYAPYVSHKLRDRLNHLYAVKHLEHVSNSSTELIAPSEKVMNYLRHKGSDRYINIIPTAIDPSNYLVDDTALQNIKRLRTKYHLKEEEKVLLYVGSLSKDKNLETLIDKFQSSSIKSEIPYRLLIVGTGDIEDKLKEQVNSNGLDDKVTFVGPVDNDKIKPYYLISDLLIQTSLNETQNITLIEAILSKLIVLTIEDETLMSLKDDEKICFTYANDEEFIKQVEYIFGMNEKEKDAFKESAKNVVENRYSLQEYYEKTINVYERAKRKNW